MASVYRAFDRLEQKLVALKVQSGDGPAGPDHPLSGEFEAWSRLRHPNIVRALELRRAGSGPLAAGVPYLVLEHVRGRSLGDSLEPGAVPAPALQRIAAQVLRGLGHIHQAGLVHRDLKPANVLVDDNRRTVKLTDLGLAAAEGTVENGTISGSLPYVSPEALIGLPIDGRADLYSLGILLAHLATGKHPVPRRSPEEAIRWHLTGPPIRLDCATRLPARLARFIERLTRRDRERRPHSASAALRQLGERSARERPPAPPAGRADRAALLLALDATLRGERRTQEFPRAPLRAESLLHDARVRSQMLGLGFHRIGETCANGRLSLEGLVLRLMTEYGDTARLKVDELGLADRLRLGRIGPLPLPDRSRGRSPCQGPGIAGLVADLVDELSRRRGLVLHVERSSPPGSGARALLARLSRLCATWTEGAGGGGMLLLI